MATEKSLYRKIQLVLEVAQSARAASLQELAERINGRELPSFLTLQYDQEADEFHWRQSGRVIRRTVRFSCRLRLLEAEGGLTPEGRKAMRRTQYDRVLAAQVQSALEREGVTLDAINKVIHRSLRADPPVLPTAQEVWEALGADIGLADFSRMLTLLSCCGVAKSSQKKIYLRIEGNSAR